MLSEPELWNKILNYNIDDVDSQMKFSHRLMNENLGWSYQYTLRVIHEYKKFIYLGCLGNSVTPSEDVDQCWHLHMLYTRSYWNDLCEGILGFPFHHGPTKGGKAEEVKFNTLYVETLARYYSEFDEEWPTDIWPNAATRFYPWKFQRVCMNTHYVVPVGDIRALFKVLFNAIKGKIKWHFF
jgi:hypothetical protein